MGARLNAAGRAFTLVEVLVSAAIIMGLVSILMPSLRSARQRARATACAAQLHQLGIAVQGYASDYFGAVVGSPNTSGYGAFANSAIEQGYGYRYDPGRDSSAATHIFDWASPLLPYVGGRPDPNRPARQRESRERIFLCPANDRLVSNSFSGVQRAPSYATCMYQLFADEGQRSPTTFFTADFLSYPYRPNMDEVSNASWKVFLADAHKAQRPDAAVLNAFDRGYTTHGAWRNNDYSLVYRWEPARKYSYRHFGGINALFFDGHVDHLSEAESRQAIYWFPSGTITSRLPAFAKGREEDMVVP